MPPKKNAGGDLDDAFWKLLKKGDGSKVTKYLSDKSDMEKNKILTTANGKNDVPLIYAATSGNEDLAEALINAGANPNVQESKGEKQTPLLISCFNGDDVMVQTLIRLGADVKTTGAKGQGVFHACARMSEDALCEYLMDLDKVFPNDGKKLDALAAKDTDGANPLHYACGEAGSDQKAMKVAEFFVKICSGALKKAAGTESAELTLQKVDSIVNAATSGTSVTPLHLLLGGEVDNRYVASLALDLITLGSDVSAEDEDGQTPLHLAAGAGMLLTLDSLVGFLATDSDDKAKALVKKKEIVMNTRSKATGETMLHAAASSGDISGLQWVIKAALAGKSFGEDENEEEMKKFVSIYDKEDEQALHKGLRGGYSQIIQTLLDNGASQEIVDIFEEEEQNLIDEEEAQTAAEKEAGGKAGDFSGQGSGGQKMSAETRADIENKIKKAQAARRAEAAAERERLREEEGDAAASSSKPAASAAAAGKKAPLKKGGASKKIPNSASVNDDDDDDQSAASSGTVSKSTKNGTNGPTTASLCILFLVFFGALTPIWSLFLGTKKEMDPVL